MEQQTSRRRSADSRNNMQQYYRTITKNKRRKKRRNANQLSSILIVCISLLSIGAIIAGGIFVCKMNQGEPSNNTNVLANGITIAGVDVSGMTQEEAIAAICNATDSKYAATPMTVKVLDSEIQIEPDTSELKLDVYGAVNAAFAQNTSGCVELSPFLSFNEEAVKKSLEELGLKYNGNVKQTEIQVAGTVPNLKLVVTKGVSAYGLDVNKLYQQVLDAYLSGTFVVEGECGLVEPSPVDLQSFWNQYHVDPVDASFVSDTFNVSESSDGCTFDVEKANKQIAEAAQGTTVEISFVAVKPKVTTEDLRNLLYRDTLSDCVADEKDSDADRNTNLQLACQAINGYIIYPNQIFSYNEVLGERTEARGYRPGPTIVNGQMSTTIGGGICQVSSALYYCTLIADLKIVERDCHGFLPDYVPNGMDAAVSWGYMDFRFQNNTNYPIRIEAIAEGGKVTVKLVGTNEKDYYIKMESIEDTSKQQDPLVTVQELPANNPEGYKNGDYIVVPKTGCYFTTYRCKYKTGTDEFISRELEDTSSYNKCDGVICKIIVELDDTGSQTPGIGNGGVTEDGALD